MLSGTVDVDVVVDDDSDSVVELELDDEDGFTALGAFGARLLMSRKTCIDVSPYSYTYP